MAKSINQLSGFLPEGRRLLSAAGSVGVPFGTPVNSVQASVVIPAAVFGLIENGDTVEFDGAEFEKVATVNTSNEDYGFDNAPALEGLFDDLHAWQASESSAVVTVTAKDGGVRFNGYTVEITKLEDTTDNGTDTSAATAEINDTTTAQMANGDEVHFDGNVFTKAGATDVGDKEFANAAGLILCIDALADWGAADTTGEITITAGADGEAFNDIDVVVKFYRTTASGVDGTEAYGPGAVMADANRIYICTDGGGKSDVTWMRSANALIAL